MVEVVATERGYYGGARRDPGERFSLADALWKDEKRRPKWVRLARQGDKAIGKGEADAADKRPAAKPAKSPAPSDPAMPLEPAGNGVQQELGGPAPDWLPPDPQNASQPDD
ncbi:uncharacterized protein with LGFP repeats [Rhizobium sp. BK529]|uniref:hypothetical protein n=1 Tax=Rhizobium sp. BK529 TaxID=2586983 RepID=UPI001618E801|nr:hypothetical protein [Rhizobium sp. BK529]MBB3590673.1 uncharacterized protein with LGFP repeats [Rhizobium sp. BK529]